MKRTSFLLLPLFIVACTSATVITSFEECKAAGNPILESYPEQCIANDEVFINTAQVVQPEPEVALTESYYNADKKELLLIGQAPGTWFFEGTMSVVIKNTSGTVIIESYVQSVGNWMTTESVEFNRVLPIMLTPNTRYIVEIQKVSMEDGSIKDRKQFEIDTTN